MTLPQPGATFQSGMDSWLDRLGNLRNIVRQEVIARQVAQHLPSPPATVLDVGAGQGTQAVRLARLGFDVIALEPDPHMRQAAKSTLADESPDTVSRIRIQAGAIADLVERADRTDVVLCHGVLMYLDSPDDAVHALARAVAPGGLLSLVARNAEGLALRPALRGDWRATLATVDELEAADAQGRDPRYTNEIGVESARADRTERLVALLQEAGLTIEAHYGVRIASDRVPVDAQVPDQDELEDLVAAELALGGRDPYRRIGSLTHLLARRPGA